MAGIPEIKTLLTVVKGIRDQLNQKKVNSISAHKAINTAFIQTYHYLLNEKGAYVPKPELAEAWNNASAAVMHIDKDLGQMLYMKSRFWLDPDLYINLGREDEVIELGQIVSEMERIRMRM